MTIAWMTKQPFVSTTDSSLRTLSSTYDKDASKYTSLLFDFVATGLRTIQFLFTSEISTQCLFIVAKNSSNFRSCSSIRTLLCLFCVLIHAKDFLSEHFLSSVTESAPGLGITNIIFLTLVHFLANYKSRQNLWWR
jgi:hypothetical protein